MGSPSFRNEFSGSADWVSQVGHHIGDTIYMLPPVPEPPAHVPRQVPPADRYFVDRAPELARFADLGSAAGVPPPVLVLVTGTPGVGKTAFARRVVEAVGRRFDVELHVDYAALRSEVGGEAAVGEAQVAILRDLGVKDRYLPTTNEARKNLLRTYTAGRTVLLVLDDVTEARQVRDLLPKSPGSLVLVTSNQRIGELVSFDGAELHVLDRLDVDSARELLVTVCGSERVDAEPAAVTDLIRLCDRLPLALRVAAARLVTEPALTVADLVAEVRQGLDALSLAGHQGVSAVFTAAYQTLPAAARRLYRIVGAVPGLELTTELAEVALGLSTREAQTAVHALHGANLVKDRPGRRYQFFDLVRRHAAALAAKNENTRALPRIVDHFLVRAAFADRAVMGTDRLRLADAARLVVAEDDPFTGEAAAALRWLYDERLNLMAILGLCDKRGWDERTYQLAEALAALFLNRRSPYDLMDTCRLGATAATRLRRADMRARMLAMGSRGSLDLGRRDQARRDLELALSLAEQSGTMLLRASVWEFWGRYLDEVDPEQAVGAYRTSIELNEQAVAAGDPRGRRGAALATYFLGGTTLRLGRHDEALVHLRHALSELRVLDDERMAARVQASVGAAYAALGRDAEAAESLLAAVRVLADRGAAHYEAEALETLATVTDRRGDHDAAQAARARAREIREATGG